MWLEDVGFHMNEFNGKGIPFFKYKFLSKLVSYANCYEFINEIKSFNFYFKIV